MSSATMTELRPEMVFPPRRVNAFIPSTREALTTVSMGKPVKVAVRLVFPKKRTVSVLWRVPWRVGSEAGDCAVTFPRKQETARMHPMRSVVVFIWPVDEVRVKKVC